MPELRLLKVHVQPVFVLLDDDGASELIGEVAVVPGKEWDGFPARFAAELGRLKQSYEE